MRNKVLEFCFSKIGAHRGQILVKNMSISACDINSSFNFLVCAFYYFISIITQSIYMPNKVLEFCFDNFRTKIGPLWAPIFENQNSKTLLRIYIYYVTTLHRNKMHKIKTERGV